jgi:cold-inducible RNA-binding protein
MSQNLYVGNLSYDTTEDDLRTAFAPHGVVLSAQVVTDRETGKPRGFGFVEMSNGGPDAIKALNLSELHGRNITVNEARPRTEGSRRGPSRRY